jgi:thiamine kinase
MATQPLHLSSAQDVRRAIERALGCSLADAQLESAGTGARNTLWRIHGRGYEWMARVARPHPDLDLDVEQEYAAHAAAARAGIAPAVVLTEPAQRLLVMQAVPGAPWSAADVRARITQLAARVRELHTLAAPLELAAFDLVEGVLALIARADNSAPVDLNLERLRVRTTELAARHRPAERMVFCHNDLHHLNLLGEQPLVVDWEYAARGDPRVDLAALATYHDLDTQQRAELLRVYGGVWGREEFDVVCALFDALHIAWLVAAGVWEETQVARRATLMARVGMQGNSR